MIKTVRHKGLMQFWTTGKSKLVAPDLQKRVTVRLIALDVAVKPEDLNIPGFNFHGLEGEPKRYSVHVNGNWCITFGWDGQDAIDVDLEDYH